MGGARSQLFISCLGSILIIYCSFCIFTLSLSLYKSTGLLLLTCILFGVFMKFSIPASDANFVTLLSCKETSNKVIGKGRDRCPQNTEVVAHRACGLDAPENSIAALKKVIKEGIKAVEFDVMLTKDNVPIVFHDETITRMANDGRKINDLTYNDLCTIDISVMHPFKELYTGECVPTLKTFVERCIMNNIRMFMDLKSSGLELVPHILKTFKDYPQLESQAVVTSFNPLLIYKIRSANPRITGCLAWRPFYCSYDNYTGLDGPQFPRTSNKIMHLLYRVLDVVHYWSLWYFIYYIVGLSAILLHKDAVTRDDIEHWKRRGVRVFAWTVNLPSEKIYFEKILQVPYLTDTVIT